MRGIDSKPHVLIYDGRIESQQISPIYRLTTTDPPPQYETCNNSIGL